MKVDIIMPTHNPGSYIIEAIDSCLNQSYKDIRLTVINDGSDKDLENIIKRYPGVNFIATPKNMGPAGARNFGINNTSNSFISFLDDDDVMDKDKIYYSIEEFKNNPSIGMTCGNYQPIVNGRVSRPFYSSPIVINYDNLMKVNFVASGSVTVRREVINAVGNFDEQYWICEDYDCWIKISERYPIKYIDKVLYFYRRNKDGRSLTNRHDINYKELDNIFRIKKQSKERMRKD